MIGLEATVERFTPFTIANYRLEDREHLIAIINTVCHEGRWMHTNCFKVTLRWAHALAHPKCPEHLLLVLRIKDRPIGWCRLFPTDIPWEATLGIGLLPTYRNQGLGTCLVQQAVKWAENRDLSHLELTTRRENWRAIHVFEKCGFASVEQFNCIWTSMSHVLRDAKTRSSYCEV
jgi:RimJ/RimL family protein N-acetyltransferase